MDKASGASGRSRWRLYPSSLRPGELLSRDFSIAEATVVLMASFVLSALLGSIQQVLFNAQFGAGAEASAFYAALRLRDLFYALLAGRALSSAMIPVLADVSRSGGLPAQWRLVNLVLTSLVLGLAVLVLGCQLLAPLIVSTVLAPGFDPETSGLTVSLIRIVLLQPLVVAFSSVATSYLNSRHRFLLTSLSLTCLNLGVILGIAAARVEPALGVAGPALGVLAGAVLQVLVLLPELRASGFRIRPVWQPADPRLRDVGRLLAPVSASAGVGYAGLILDTAFASFAPEAAAVPAVYNAWLLITLPLSMLGKAVGQSAFPRLAESTVARDWRRLRRTLARATGTATGLALPAALALIVFGRQIIRVLFEHGRFDAAAGAVTYTILATYAIALPAYVGLEVLVRGLIALRDTRTPLLADLGQLLGRAVLLALLLGRLGVVAVPLALAVMSYAELVLLAIVLRLQLRRAAAATVPAVDDDGVHPLSSGSVVA
jgi:putative peptidoglycan lipid II flippase